MGCDGGRFFLLRLYRLYRERTLFQGTESAEGLRARQELVRQREEHWGVKEDIEEAGLLRYVINILISSIDSQPCFLSASYCINTTVYFRITKTWKVSQESQRNCWHLY